MNKKIVALIVSLLTLVLIILVMYNERGYNYNDLIITDKEYNEIIAKRKLVNKSMISNIRFNDGNLIYDSDDDIYYYSIVDNNNWDNPVIKYNSTNGNVKIAMLDKISKNKIKNNESISAIAYNKKKYFKFSIKLTTLPVMNIVYNENQEITRDDVKMKMVLFDNSKNANNRTIVSDGMFHIRGRSTSLYPKQSYRLSLTKLSAGKNKRANNISLLGMRQDDDWILYAAYNDQEKVRNVFSSNLWYYSCANNNKFGINNGMQYKYVELFLNGHYHGLYALGYPIDSKQLQLNIDANNGNNEYLFKNTSWTSAGTVLQNLDNKEKYELDSRSVEYLAWNEIKNYYSVLMSSNSITELYEISDINNVIDNYLFLYLVQGSDNALVSEDSHISNLYMKNMYIAFKKEKDRYVALYTPWDLDITFGNIWTDDAKNMTMTYGRKPGLYTRFDFNAIYYLRKLGDKRIDIMIKDRYKELRKGFWSNDSIRDMLNKYELEIYDSGAFIRDKDRWPGGNYNDADERLSRFKEYVYEQLSCMDEVILKGVK